MHIIYYIDIYVYLCITQILIDLIITYMNGYSCFHCTWDQNSDPYNPNSSPYGPDSGPYGPDSGPYGQSCRQNTPDSDPIHPNRGGPYVPNICPNHPNSGPYGPNNSPNSPNNGPIRPNSGPYRPMLLDAAAMCHILTSLLRRDLRIGTETAASRSASHKERANKSTAGNI